MAVGPRISRKARTSSACAASLKILSRGREGRLGVSPETLSLLATRGVPVALEKTDAARRTTGWQPKGAESQGSSTPPASSSVEVVGCDHIDTRLPA